MDTTCIAPNMTIWRQVNEVDEPPDESSKESAAECPTNFPDTTGKWRVGVLPPPDIEQNMLKMDDLIPTEVTRQFTTFWLLAV